MSRPSSKLANGSDAITPGSYNIDRIILTTNDNQEYNITAIVAQILVRESIYMGSLQYEFNILDAANMLEKLKCVSGERLSLRVSRSSIGGEIKRYKADMRIAEIHSFAKLSPGTQTYVFRCVSEHAYINQVKTISKPFNDVAGSLINKICTQELKIPKKKLSINTETKQTIVGVYPRIRPMGAINWLIRRSFDNATPFFFYETLADGVHFNSYENCINKESHKTYEHSPYNNKIVGSAENAEMLSKKVLKFASDLNISKYVKASRGAYGSTLHTLDINTKTYKKQTYSYGKQLQLNNNGLLPKELKLDDRLIQECSDSTNFYISTNTSAVSGGSNYHTLVEGQILHANAYIENMDAMKVDIDIYGDFDLSVGMTLDLDIRKSEDAGNNNRGKDLFLSGKYLITSINHKFEEDYIMSITCTKDSFIESLDKIEKIGDT